MMMTTKRDWKKQLKRVKDIADKNFARGEKPEQLNESLTKLEQRIDNIKQVCQAVGKKLLACLQLHGVDTEKRSKKLPDSVLSKQLQESSALFEDNDAFRRTLSLCSKVEEQLANHKISYENDIETNVLVPLQQLTERDIPVIIKSRKLVLKQAQEVEVLKSRHSTIARQSALPQEGAKKLAQAQEDLEEAVNKLELYKDLLATEMYNFHAKESDITKIFIGLIELQLKYHADASTALENVLPEMKSVDECVQHPVFGVSLEDHLRHAKRSVALVLNECITALQREGMELEGLFRVAGGATKLKKLRAAFDAGMVDMEEYMVDPHCVASVLKLYLRELPEPIMTFELYDDWAEAAHCSGELRINAIAKTLKKMRRPHFENLKFLVQFLSQLTDFSEVNKMSASNLAIVVGPNLLWSQAGDGQNILSTGVQSAIAETMISNAALFFGEDPEFGIGPGDTVSLVMPSSVSSRGGDNHGVTKQMMRKVDSNDSLSSDSFGADSNTTATNASTISSSDVSLVTRNVEVDVGNLVPPKRTGKKSHAPLPPSNESTVTSASANAAGSTATPGEHVEIGADSGTNPSSVADHVEPNDLDNILPHASKANVTKVQPKDVDAKTVATLSADETETRRRKTLNAADVNSNSDHRGQKENAAEDKTAVAPNAKKPTQFAKNQALLSNVLSPGPRKTLLTRPNTTYMEKAKFELMQTADEQNDGESSDGSSSTSNVNPADNHSKKTTDAGKDARKQSTDASSMSSNVLPIADVLKSTGHEEKNDDAAVQKLDEEPTKRKPERPTKPFRRTPSEGGGGETRNIFKLESNSKAAPEEFGNVPRNEDPVAVSPPQQQINHDSAARASTLPKVSSKSSLQEAPNSGHQQSGGAGMRPSKPPPPLPDGSPRLPSSSNEEDTRL